MLAPWLILVAAVALSADPHEAGDARVEVSLNGHNFTLPAGFEIELVAGPPLVDRPITADFDEQGRLYVAESSGSNEKVEEQLQKKPHRILRLVDTNGDGRFDERTVFADSVMLPEGTMWHAGSLYVAAPPSIWKFTDTNGDGVADHREEWFQGKTLTGCANDLHGPYLGRDGWIYWCKGAFAKQTYPRRGGGEWSTHASHIFRCRPDGSELQPVMTGGMDNPVDVVFTSTGERIFSCTFLQHPGGGKRDGLIHAIYGGVYGKDHYPVHEHPWTGPSLMPVLSHLGPAAPCGLVHCDTAGLGEEYQGNLFTAAFNMRKIVRHVLSPQGSALESQDEDFLVSDHVDFHPTDVLEDADGSLLVVDTGGWYKLCCPTSQVEKPDVLGGIYRIRRQGAAPPKDPRGLKIDWASLTADEAVKLFGDERVAVQRRAIEHLAALGDDAAPHLKRCVVESDSPLARRNAVWTACRLDAAVGGPIALEALGENDLQQRQVALQAISLLQYAGASDELVRLLNDKLPVLRRLAAEALGRMQANATRPLLDSIDRHPPGDDRALEHALIYALLEIADVRELERHLSKRSPASRRAALIVLDQLKSDLLTHEVVLRDFDADDDYLRSTAEWIASRHSEWGGPLADRFERRLQQGEPFDEAEQRRLIDQLAGLSSSPHIQKLLARLAIEATPNINALALEAMGKSAVRPAPEAWLSAIAAAIKKQKQGSETLTLALSTARTLAHEKQGASPLHESLVQLASDERFSAEERLLALSARRLSNLSLDGETLTLVRRELRGESARLLAAEVLASAELSDDQLLLVCDDLAELGPIEADALLKAAARAKSERVGLRLAEALRSSPLKESLPVGMLRERLGGFGPEVQIELEKLYAELDAAAQGQRERLEAMLIALPSGDVRRGQHVFHSAKAACSACHAIGYAGGTVGPDLTRIGGIRTDRDLLESVLFPSNSFVRGYEPVVIVASDGKSHSGVMRDETANDILLITGANQSIRIPRSEIEETHLGKVSVMPSGLESQLTPQQLADLLAYLRSCR
jgi:putative membrane-bound dehydrogenase-like protein